jgi:hypothetical protein
MKYVDENKGKEHGRVVEDVDEIFVVTNGGREGTNRAAAIFEDAVDDAELSKSSAVSSASIKFAKDKKKYGPKWGMEVRTRIKAKDI